jgi:hypothetical protein
MRYCKAHRVVCHLHRLNQEQDKYITWQLSDVVMTTCTWSGRDTLNAVLSEVGDGVFLQQKEEPVQTWLQIHSNKATAAVAFSAVVQGLTVPHIFP